MQPPSEKTFLIREDKRRHYWFGSRANAALLKRVEPGDTVTRIGILRKDNACSNLRNRTRIYIFNFFNITGRVLYYVGVHAFKRLRVLCKLLHANNMLKRFFLRTLVNIAVNHCKRLSCFVGFCQLRNKKSHFSIACQPTFDYRTHAQKHNIFLCINAPGRPHASHYLGAPCTTE